MPASPLSSAPAPAAPLTLREFGDVNATRQAIYDRVFQAASSLPPVSNTRHTLKLTDVAWADPDAFSPAQHRQAVLAGKTLGRRLRGTWQLLDNASGQVLDRKSTILATVPHLTAGGTFVNHGNDYVLANQVRLKNGAFARRKASGEYEVHANVLSGGPAHRYELDPAKGTFSLHVGQANLPLLPLLQSLGATDREIRDAWGPELFAANYAAADASALPRLRQHFSRGADLKAAFEGMSLDPKVTQRTLGGAHARLDKSALLAITAKLLAVSRGQAEVDDRDHLAYQQFLAPEDLLAERLLKDKGGVRRQLLFKASNRGHLQSLPSSALQKQVDSAILESGLGRYPEEVNPLELLDKRTQITRMGEGGIGSTDAIPDEARSVLPSHLGFLDPVRTPESERAGVDVYLAGGIRKGSDGQVYARFRDARTGKEVWKTPQDAADAIVAFPDALTRPGRRVPAVINGRLGWADRRKVDLVAPPFEQAFSPLGNLIPLKSMIKPQRMAMGSRFLTQALPLVQPEAPLVQSALPGSRGQKSYEEEYASHAGAIRAEHGGQVLDAKAGAITVRYDDGQTAEIPLYNNLPYNRKTFHHQTPAVTPGQRFGPGQLLATSNYTDAGGSIALGLNARIGLMPWGGSVADDTPVLCYDAAGLPHYGPIREVITVPDFSALATDPETLQTVVLPSRGLSVHSANTLLRIQTSSGRVLRATPEHSFMTLAADGRLVEIRGDQLVPGQSYLPRLCQVDLPVRIRQIECSYKRLRAKLSVTLDENFGFICGIYAAEGFVHARNGAIIIAATDPKTREAVILAFNRVAPGITHNDRNPNAVNFYDARLGHWLRENIGHRSQVKRVPDVAFAAPLEFRRGFVAGFWTGDGRVSSRPDGGCKDTDTLITSKRLRDGLGLLLASLSISTTHREYDVPKCTEGKIYRLGISTRDAHKLPDIRPYHSTKGDRLAAVISSYKGNGSADVMPLPAEAAEAYSCYARGQDKRTASRIRAQASRKVVNRHDVLTLVPESADGVLNRLRQLAASSIEWDLVESVTPGACTQWVYDFDMAPLRTFVCLDTLVVHNSNFEDAIVISESLAKRLTSTHAYQHSLEVTDRMRTGKAAYLSLFPAKYPRAVLDKLDEKGIARIGSTVQQGEPLILAAAERDRAQNRLHKKRQMGFSDATVTWEHADPGTVVDVVEGEKGPVVLVQSQHPMQVSDKMCYSADTEVLTDTGWYLFSELKPQQRLASLTSTGRLEYVKPAAFHVYDHVGRMYALQTTQVDLCVTDNHKLYAKPGDKRTKAPYQLLEAQALAGTNYHLKMDAAWTGRDPEAFVLPALRVVAGQYGHGFRDIPEKRIALKTYAMILGLFLSEGNLVNTPWHGDYGIDITQVKPDTKAKIVAALKQSGLKFSTHGKGDKFRIFGKQWLEHFKDMPSCIHKYIPSFVFSWSKETLRELYFWLMLGDGCEKGTGHNYSTTSRRLADDVQRLCLHIGYAAKVEQRHSGGVQTILGRRHMTKPSYSVRIYRSKTTPEINHPHVAEQNGQAEKWIDYRGKVYCVTLPRNHVIYVRRNGKACWAGNSARYGNKGVVAAIVPDAQMPHDAQGQPLEALFNPLGVISRGNPAQVVEMALSKVARKLGHPLKIEDFDASIPDRIEWAQNLLRQHGLSDREDLIDPATGRKIPGVLTGEQFIMKLLHTGESKGQARSSGGYDVWDAPAKGGESGAKRMALMDTNALLSHNAPNVLHDAHAIRGHKNENWWLSFMSGHTPPALKVPLVYEKFVNDLKASGINVVRHGSQLQLLAMTDADVDQLAGDRELQNAETVHFDKDLKPITGGLFDPTLTGGHRSGRWSAIRLAEPMPNPAFEEPIRRVLGLTRKAFEAVLAGRQELQPGGGSGPAAIAKALTAIDLTRELALTRAKAQLGSKSDRDAAVRKLGYLKAAQSTGVHPSQWLLKRVPVLPPQFRPVAQIADKQIPLVADANGLYRELFEANANLADMKKQVGEGELGDERLAVYHAFKAVVGLGDPITQQSREQKLGGILAHVFGSSPKFSSVQRQLLSTTVDNVGRAVIVPNPDLDMDSLGLPEDKAFDVYERYIARRLRRSGLPLAQALRHVRERTPQARAALTAEMNERPVIANRAPVLHRFGILAFRPHLVKGSALHVPPLVYRGFAADNDGDTFQYHVPASEAAVQEAYDRMLPSRQLFSPSDFKSPVHTLSQEYAGGLWTAATQKSNRPVRTFRSRKDVRHAWLAGEIGVTDPVRVLEDEK